MMTGFDQQGKHAGLPIVDVDHVRGEAKLPEKRLHRHREEGEALPVVGEAIKRTAQEIVIVADEVEGHPGEFGLVDRRLLLPPGKIDFVFEELLITAGRDFGEGGIIR